MHISDLPSELHTHIVELACTEIPLSSELSSARSLSRVSPYWYSVARPFRYHAVRIAGSRNIAELLSTLEKLSEREKRTMLVRHLSLSDTFAFTSLGSSSDSDSEAEEVEVVLDNNDESLIQTKSNIARLLALLIPSLYSLELHLASLAYSTSLIAMLWELPAPYLVSLSVKGYYPFPSAPLGLGLPFRSSSSSSSSSSWGEGFGQPNAAATSSSASNSNFPRLEYLSLDGVSNPSGLLSFDALGYVFPRLEALEIRGLRGALAFAHEVVDAVRERDGSRSRSRCNNASKGVGDSANLAAKQVYEHDWQALRSSRPLPDRLRRLSLFLAEQEPNGRFSKRGNALHKKMLNVLMSVASRDDVPESEGGLRVFVEAGDSDFSGESAI